MSKKEPIVKTRIIQPDPDQQDVPDPTATQEEQKMPTKPESPRRSSRRHGAIMAVVAALAVAAPVPAFADTDGGSTPAPTIAWEACGPAFDCATVQVPLDWVHPDGRMIQLAVTRHRASHPERRIGSLFVNPGGPGDSGVDMAFGRGEALDALTEGRFDVVGWDLRGTARSAPVSCFASSAERAAFWQGISVPTSARQQRRFVAKTVDLAERCGALNGDLLSHISTADTARDLDYLRRAVGDPALNYFGESVGTFIGETYANMFPDHVRAMALDGVEDPVAFTTSTERLLATTLVSVDQEFDQFVKLCEQAGPELCPLAGDGSVARRVHRILAGIRRTPIPAPSATPPGELDYGEMLTLIKFAQLPDPSLWPAVGALLAQAEAGDASALEGLLSGDASEQFHHAIETNTVLLCADSPTRRDPRQWPEVVNRLETVSRLGAAPMAWLVAAPCASWPARSVNRYTGPWNAKTPNPILLIGTRFDPNTPLANAQKVEKLLGNAVLLTHDGYGHPSHADPSACVVSALGQYLVDLTTPAPATVCPSDHLPFDPAFGQPSG